MSKMSELAIDEMNMKKKMEDEEFQKLKGDYEAAINKMSQKRQEKADRIAEWLKNVQNTSMLVGDERLTDKEMTEIAMALAYDIVPFPNTACKAYIQSEVNREE